MQMRLTPKPLVEYNNIHKSERERLGSLLFIQLLLQCFIFFHSQQIRSEDLHMIIDNNTISLIINLTYKSTEDMLHGAAELAANAAAAATASSR
jgi:hypothetical protein